MKKKNFVKTKVYRYNENKFDVKKVHWNYEKFGEIKMFHFFKTSKINGFIKVSMATLFCCRISTKHNINSIVLDLSLLSNNKSVFKYVERNMKK